MGRPEQSHFWTTETMWDNANLLTITVVKLKKKILMKKQSYFSAVEWSSDELRVLQFLFFE